LTPRRFVDRWMLRDRLFGVPGFGTGSAANVMLVARRRD
jgi:hypothetical protein